MKDYSLLEKYSDWSIAMIDMLNAKRKFGFSIHSLRNFQKMLWKEDIRFVSMSSETWSIFRRRFGDKVTNSFGIAEDPKYYFGSFFNRDCLFHEEMEKGEVMMIDGNDDVIVMKISK